ncbi:hypothetical protein GCM10023107_70170 [Actinoplanes octamycinicus]|nr:hypothetical protein Aoc01nite_27060 [Actinoplanes octamycinicus]
MAVLLCAAALGPWRGPAATLAYVFAGLAGVPWFAGGASGLTGATFGYLLGMIAAAAVVGALARYGADRTPWRTVPAMLLGNVVIYTVGVSWLAVTLHLNATTAVRVGLVPFLLGDALKVLIAAGVLPAAWHLTRRTPRSR